MKRLHDEEEGQALVLLAIMMLTLLFFVGLAIDVGQLYNGRRTAQEAADASAFAGAVTLYQQATNQQAKDEAYKDASLNGYAANIPTTNTTVVVQSPPLSGAFQGDVHCVSVTISTPIRTSLVPQQAGLTTVGTTAVACAAPFQPTWAVMALDQQCDSGTAAVSSNGTLAVHNGGILINSCSASAGQNSGSVTHVVDPAPYLDAGSETDVVGNVQGTWPNLVTGYAVQPDPFATAIKPSTYGLVTYSPACAPTINRPGIYTSTASNNCLYIFAPGTYIWKGSGLDLSGSKAGVCTGPTCSTPTAAGGVFFFFTSSNYPSLSGSCASQPVKIEGGVNTVLSPPDSGTYKGMLIWQDSICTANLNFGGGGSITTTGSIYAPTACVDGNGQNSAVNLSQVVAKCVDTQNAAFTITYAPDVTYQPIIPALVE